MEVNESSKESRWICGDTFKKKKTKKNSASTREIITDAARCSNSQLQPCSRDLQAAKRKKSHHTIITTNEDILTRLKIHQQAS